MPSNSGTIFIVEDDQSVRDALALLLGLKGYAVTVFADAESFLSAFKPQWSGCLLIDIRMPGMDGLSLQKQLLAIGCTIPVVIMTGHGSAESARDAFRAQAVDFLEKPLSNEKLMSAIDEALIRQAGIQERKDKQAVSTRLLQSLTPRERDVMDLVVTGSHNRDIADLLGISVRTVEVHKARMMMKLQVESVAELVRLSLLGQQNMLEMTPQKK